MSVILLYMLMMIIIVEGYYLKMLYQEKCTFYLDKI